MHNFIFLAASDGHRSGVSVLSLLGIIQSLGWHVAVWVRTCADYHAAAAMYEQRSGLCDAELQRRGLLRLGPRHRQRPARVAVIAAPSPQGQLR